MSIAERIIKLRKKHSLSQEKLSEKIFVSRQTISKWEFGQVMPDIDNIKSICDFFSVSVDYLINGSEINKSSKRRVIIDIFVLVAGIILLITFLILMIVNRDKLSDISSIIEINEYGVLATFSIAISIVAIFLIYKNKKK